MCNFNNFDIFTFCYDCFDILKCNNNLTAVNSKQNILIRISLLPNFTHYWLETSNLKLFNVIFNYASMSLFRTNLLRNKKHNNKISQAAFPVVTRSRDQVPKLKFIANFIVKPSRSIESVGKCTVRRYQVSIQRSSYSYTIERSLSKEREIHQIRNCNCNK